MTVQSYNSSNMLVNSQLVSSLPTVGILNQFTSVPYEGQYRNYKVTSKHSLPSEKKTARLFFFFFFFFFGGGGFQFKKEA